ncbi:PD-(D/E)XK nuclease family protein [Salisaeta longa]|uniref:PD-(D/E)XK nuclease family protein n=1 Tax=Salisaeta longa TaxID=503170 RepID=UPI0003B3AC1E|nr:PD-(D/E)XK nuclease family protein [Salisaeta longa]
MDASSPSASPAAVSTIVDQVARLCTKHPLAPKWVLVPYQQLGRALVTAVARSVAPCSGLRCITPWHLAKELASERLPPDQRLIDGVGREVLVGDLLRAMEDAALDAPERLVRPLADALATLRATNVTPADLPGRNAAGLAQYLPALLQAYEDRLQAEGLYDRADVFRWAAASVPQRVPPQAVVAVPGETELHQRALQLVLALRDHSAQTYTLAPPRSDQAPAHTAAALLGDRPGIEQLRAEPRGPRHITPVRAAGPIREVRAVLRRILDRETPLDQVEIAYAASQPYLPLLIDEAEKAGVPATAGPGLPGPTLRPFQALIGAYRWLANGFAADELIHLLRARLLRIGPWLSRQQDAAANDPGHWYAALDTAPTVDGPQAASLLAESRYPPHRNGYEQILSARIDRCAEASTDERQRTHDRLVVVRAWLRDVIGSLPEPVTVGAMADWSEALLDRFGPSLDACPLGTQRPPLPSASGATDRPGTYDQVAHRVLHATIFPEWRTLAVDPPQSLGAVLPVLRNELTSRYVGARRPQPGALHIVPLDSAGFMGRTDLYVVGLDNETTAVASLDDPVLRGPVRATLSEEQAATVAHPRRAADAAAWRFRAALDRHTGAQTLVAMHFDPATGEERFASTLYRDHLAAHQVPPGTAAREGFVPPAQLPALSADEAWLVATHPASAPPAAGDPPPSTAWSTARAALHAQHPWIRDGEQARAARAADRYTAYDGLLSAADYPALDPLDPSYRGAPLSANRLQTLAASPYAYFVKYVLRVRPLNEPALHDEPWLDALRKGAILHRAFEQFMREDPEALATDAAHERLMDHIDACIDDWAARDHIGAGTSRDSIRKRLMLPARLFVESERQRADAFEPLHVEWGFGYRGARKRRGDAGPFRLRLPDGAAVPLRGRIDRIDTAADGRLHLWDYKTGSRYSFDTEWPLKHGETLQWALYGAVAHQHFDRPVAESGYAFFSVKEMGNRLSWPLDERAETALHGTLRHLMRLLRTGTFPMRPDLDAASSWAFGAYDALVPDLDARKRALAAKAFPEEARPVPHFLQ